MAVPAEEFSLMKAIDYVARQTASKFRIVERDDVAQELWVFALDEGKEDLDAALLKGDTSKVFRLLFQAAGKYVRSQREEVTHHAVEEHQGEDIEWVDPHQVARFVPAVLGGMVDTNFDERPKPGGGLAPCWDIARALEACPHALEVLKEAEPESDIYLDACGELLRHMAGPHPMHEGYRGRKAVSNTLAQFWTEEGLGGVPRGGISAGGW